MREKGSFDVQPSKNPGPVSCNVYHMVEVQHYGLIPFYNTAKQWRTLQKLALTGVDPSKTEFSFLSSLASQRQSQKASKQSSELITTPIRNERRAASTK